MTKQKLPHNYMTGMRKKKKKKKKNLGNDKESVVFAFANNKYSFVRKKIYTRVVRRQRSSPERADRIRKQSLLMKDYMHNFNIAVKDSLT